MKQLSAAGYHETVAMLAIAQLDLRARLHGITEGELQYLASGTPAKAAD